MPLLAVVILVLSGLGAVALNIEKEGITTQVDTEKLGDPKDYTHTIFVEVGTASWCGSCPYSNIAWHNIYEDGQYDFEYSELVIDKNSKANSYMNSHYKLYWVPTSYFDGGQYVRPGTSTTIFKNYLNNCGSRVVPNLDASLSALWQGNSKIEISLSIENNDNDDYPGTLRVYIIELESPRWNDKDGNPYYHAFLDFPWDQPIDIDSGDTFEDNKVWDGAAAGYPNIDSDNIQVILAVFDDTPHQAYSDPPSGAPFWAYYVDETVATLVEGNQAPNKPTITGKINGKAGVEYEYTFNAVDPNGDNVKYHIYWDDGKSDVTAFNPSGTDVHVKHTWSKQGTYTIKAKAEDVSGAKSPEGTLTVTMPRGKLLTNTLFMRLLERSPNPFSLLQLLLHRPGL